MHFKVQLQEQVEALAVRGSQTKWVSSKVSKKLRLSATIGKTTFLIWLILTDEAPHWLQITFGILPLFFFFFFAQNEDREF